MSLFFHAAGIVIGLGLLIGADSSSHRALGVLIFGLACYGLGKTFS